jgi:PadR family transcriptional regulator PadR
MLVEVGPQLRKGVVESCVLGLLSRAPMYGWQLSEPLVASGMIASIGTLYPMLSRMRTQGFIESYAESSPSGPPRKFYRLTELGNVALETFRAQWVPFSASVTQLISEGVDLD